MISYDLAEKLKNTEFPQVGHGYLISKTDAEGHHINPVYIPTIDEVLTKLGDHFFSLVQAEESSGNWHATGWMPPKETSGFGAAGDSALEALINLHLTRRKLTLKL